MTSRYRCDALTNWAMKPLTLGAGHLCVLMRPWRMDVKWFMKCFIYWLFQASIRNCLNCVRNCDEHSPLDFKSTVQYMKHFIYNFTTWNLLTSKNVFKERLYPKGQGGLFNAIMIWSRHISRCRPGFSSAIWPPCWQKRLLLPNNQSEATFARVAWDLSCM